MSETNGPPALPAPETRPRCPICGALTERVDLGPDTPPWLCATDSRGWWDAELTAAAREAFNPSRRDFGALTADVMASARNERATAHERSRR